MRWLLMLLLLAACSERPEVTPEEIPAPDPDYTPPETGNITITTEPAGSDIFIAEEFVGSSPVFVDGLPYEYIEIRIEREGYETYTRDKLIYVQFPNSLHVELQPE